MGAWSTDAFGNDTACDWANGLEMWDESDAAAQWRADAQSLMERLQAEPRPLAPQVDAIGRAVLDMAAVGQVVRELLRDWDANRGLPRGASLAQAYKCVLAGDATGRPDITLEAIARMARAASALDKTTMLQDLAVRDARILICEGRLDDALAGLAPWRRVTSSAKVDARLPGRCWPIAPAGVGWRSNESAAAMMPAQWLRRPSRCW